ncbi:MAG TPA: hypothetical protein VFL47_07965, partial [Flavisolibacter sp.]|nr:hypothetical protein [Flavisolibacter sp.]
NKESNPFPKELLFVNNCGRKMMAKTKLPFSSITTYNGGHHSLANCPLPIGLTSLPAKTGFALP